ncbi:hypothetical protein [Elizabethkingia anophelis]|uniref:hypothetical protein n=1 Tax=Elizabethkingia anophelis TaxID=1117645 RepID=UPI00105482AC|nr:hypothetical protein [Elizabethkingia anophelis]
MKNLKKLTFALIALMLLFTACSKDDDDAQGNINQKQLHGKWVVNAMSGKLFVKVGNIPETELPLMSFWGGKTFYFENNNRLSVLENQTEVLDFGPYQINGDNLTVANGPGVLKVALLGNNEMTLTNKQEDYYKMMTFYNNQTESEVRQMYRVEGDIVFHLKRQ